MSNMDSTKIIDTYKKSVLLVAGSHVVGTGFYMQDWGLIVTNHHLVENEKQVKIALNHQTRKEYASVVYLDARGDLAFLKPTASFESVPLTMRFKEHLNVGDEVLALGHPFRLKYTASKGILSNLDNEKHGIHYLQHDAPLNPGNSGGPLVDLDGHLLGMNSFILDEADNISFALTVNYLSAAYDQYLAAGFDFGVVCQNCTNIVDASVALPGNRCPHCGSQIQLPVYEQPPRAVGIAGILEEVLTSLSFDPVLARDGKDSWEIIQGSAVIRLTYHQKSGLIIGEAKLAKLPRQNIKALYRFMLQKNLETNNISLSVNEQDIICSTLIFDKFFNIDTGKKILISLFKEADSLDDVLVNEYGADWNIN